MLKIIINKKVYLVSLIIIVHLIFSYYYIPGYWSASAGFIFILALSIITWKNNFAYWIGIHLKSVEILITALLAIVFLAGSIFLINTIAEANHIDIQKGNYKDILHTFFYSVNEEIIMGALVLKGIKYRWGKINNWKISVGVALGFSLVHFVFFKWIFLNTGNLNFLILLSLFCVGILRNNLILKTGHIGYSLAVHFAWVFPMLGYSHLYPLNRHYLTDFERFDIYLGDYRTVIIVLILAIISFFLLNTKTTSSG